MVGGRAVTHRHFSPKNSRCEIIVNSLLLTGIQCSDIIPVSIHDFSSKKNRVSHMGILPEKFHENCIFVCAFIPDSFTKISALAELESPETV